MFNYRPFLLAVITAVFTTHAHAMSGKGKGDPEPTLHTEHPRSSATDFQGHLQTFLAPDNSIVPTQTWQEEILAQGNPHHVSRKEFDTIISTWIDSTIQRGMDLTENYRERIEELHYFSISVARRHINLTPKQIAEVIPLIVSRVNEMHHILETHLQFTSMNPSNILMHFAHFLSRAYMARGHLCTTAIQTLQGLGRICEEKKAEDLAKDTARKLYHSTKRTVSSPPTAGPNDVQNLWQQLQSTPDRKTFVNFLTLVEWEALTPSEIIDDTNLYLKKNHKFMQRRFNFVTGSNQANQNWASVIALSRILNPQGRISKKLQNAKWMLTQFISQLLTQYQVKSQSLHAIRQETFKLKSSNIILGKLLLERIQDMPRKEELYMQAAYLYTNSMLALDLENDAQGLDLLWLQASLKESHDNMRRLYDSLPIQRRAVPSSHPTTQAASPSAKAESRVQIRKHDLTSLRKTLLKAAKSHKAKKPQHADKAAASPASTRTKELRTARQKRKEAVTKKLKVISGEMTPELEPRVNDIRTALREANTWAELEQKLIEHVGAGHNLEWVKEFGVWSIRVNDTYRITFKILKKDNGEEYKAPLRITQVRFSKHYEGL